jgi:hypothetical protein
MKCYQDDKVKEDGMGWVCGMHMTEEKCIHSFGGKLE